MPRVRSCRCYARSFQSQVSSGNCPAYHFRLLCDSAYPCTCIGEVNTGLRRNLSGRSPAIRRTQTTRQGPLMISALILVRKDHRRMSGRGVGTQSYIQHGQYFFRLLQLSQEPRQQRHGGAMNDPHGASLLGPTFQFNEPTLSVEKCNTLMETPGIEGEVLRDALSSSWLEKCGVDGSSNEMSPD